MDKVKVFKDVNEMLAFKRGKGIVVTPKERKKPKKEKKEDE